MDPVKLPWYQFSSREWRANTIYGQYRVVSHTLAPWYKRGAGATLGHTIYFGTSRIGWTVEGSDANAVAGGFAGAEIQRRTKGRLTK
jgi:hypothetical protein